MNQGIKILFGLIIVLVVITGINILLRARSSSKTEVFSRNSNLADSIKNIAKPEDDQNSNVTFLAFGDIMLSRNVAANMSKNGKDPEWPFKNISAELKTTDFNFANLESPFSGSDDFPATGSLVFNAPTWTLPGLVQNNFKVLNLANNHASDQGKAGLVYTKKVLTDAGIINIGTGANLNDAWQGKVYEVKGVKIGFIGASYASVNDGGKTRNDYVARMEDTAKLKASIADLKTKADFIVVTMHAGVEYTRTPTKLQKDFAHAAVDYGADIVIGAHPHWIQTNETYKGKPIFYSLGNFVFDQMFSQDTEEGLALKINLSKNSSDTKIKEIKLEPLIIENYGQPRLANEKEKDSILKKISATTDVITP
ncbi:MAG TPA: CapA family protein [Patescibacteria group bacterium]|jgi:poly-gamma-glutamate synthesis protein (capsule biosynthesis protein)|nr:CapA family protein [Patescibacteria group bacterium]